MLCFAVQPTYANRRCSKFLSILPQPSIRLDANSNYSHHHPRLSFVIRPIRFYCSSGATSIPILPASFAKLSNHSPRNSKLRIKVSSRRLLVPTSCLLPSPTTSHSYCIPLKFHSPHTHTLSLFIPPAHPRHPLTNHGHQNHARHLTRRQKSSLSSQNRLKVGEFPEEVWMDWSRVVLMLDLNLKDRDQDQGIKAARASVECRP
jgi:hypothetical protein